MSSPMNKSESINELAAALAKAQGMMKPAVFNKINPHFRSKYADFNSCMDACRDALSQNGLAITQTVSATADGRFLLVTTLVHSSGQWMSGEFPLLADKQTSQGIGSATTYAKRYSLSAMLGIVADEDDDDGEEALKEETKSDTAKTVALDPPVKKLRDEAGALRAKLNLANKNSFDAWIKGRDCSLMNCSEAMLHECIKHLTTKLNQQQQEKRNVA